MNAQCQSSGIALCLSLLQLLIVCMGLVVMVSGATGLRWIMRGITGVLGFVVGRVMRGVIILIVVYVLYAVCAQAGGSFWGQLTGVADQLLKPAKTPTNPTAAEFQR